MVHVYVHYDALCTNIRVYISYICTNLCISLLEHIKIIQVCRKFVFFLNVFIRKHVTLKINAKTQWQQLFTQTIAVICEAMGTGSLQLYHTNHIPSPFTTTTYYPLPRFHCAHIKQPWLWEGCFWCWVTHSGGTIYVGKSVGTFCFISLEIYTRFSVIYILCYIQKSTFDMNGTSHQLS